MAEGAAPDDPAPENSADEDSVAEDSTAEDSTVDPAAEPSAGEAEGPERADPVLAASLRAAAERESAVRAGLDAERGGGATWNAVEPPDPERLLLVVQLEASDSTDAPTIADIADIADIAAISESRYVLVRWAEGAPAQLLSVGEPGPFALLDQVVADALRMRLGLELVGSVVLGELRLPRRTAQWRVGRVATGWDRAAIVHARGEPQAQPPLFEAVALPLAEAEAALTTSAERTLLRSAGSRLV